MSAGQISSPALTASLGGPCASNAPPPSMSDCREEHDHDHEGHGHNHSHDVSDAQPNNLFDRVDHSNVVALNGITPEFPRIIKPWHERLDETVVSRTLMDPAVCTIHT